MGSVAESRRGVLTVIDSYGVSVNIHGQYCYWRSVVSENTPQLYHTVSHALG